jgi:Asp-tRNA(Asn)/Glu-tRNA(Gln) amidotransferase A subunit family amidase
MLAKVFERVDMIVTPTCPIAAPLIDATRSASHGRSDLTSSSAIMRYIFLANLCGNPAVSFPVGYAKGTGLPIGIQFMADMYGRCGVNV